MLCRCLPSSIQPDDPTGDYLGCPGEDALSTYIKAARIFCALSRLGHCSHAHELFFIFELVISVPAIKA
jgi:hypothetical protein